MNILEIKNLHVSIEGKEILKGVSMNIELGKAHALMGPNGSGKSTLANVLMGHPKYKVTKGEILYNGDDIKSMSPHERAKKGLFLSFQYPEEISGVTISNFLREAYNSKFDEKLSILESQRLLQEKAKMLDVPEDFLGRYLNGGFSGGEKKKSEILQMAFLNPKLAILDETDSGLDIDALRTVAEGVKTFMDSDKERTVLIITHYKRILDYLNPDKVSIMVDGKIVLEGDKKVVDELEERGYGFVGESNLQNQKNYL